MKNWTAIMEAISTLSGELEKDLHSANPLLQGMLVTSFHSPLLRRVIIDDIPYIAHVTPGFGKITIRGMDNPLENDSATGELRVVLHEKEALLVIERNMGPRQKDRIGQSVDDACTRAGREMMRTEDYCGPAGREFASLLQMSIPCAGSAFEWIYDTSQQISKFKHFELLPRTEKKEGRLPTYDIILRSS